MRVLVVDDNDDIRLLANTLLTIEGHQVVEASDGTAALEVVRGLDPPHVVLLDIRILSPDGLEVLDTIRAEGLPVRVIVFSAHADDATEREALDRGADAFVVKPFTPGALYESIRRVAGVQRP